MYEEIVQFYLKEICTSDNYLINNRCSDNGLLLPSFKSKIDNLIEKYIIDHESAPEKFETYRSNVRQLSLYNSGASKIKTNGMHHYGIAVDLVGKNDKGKYDYDILDYSWLRKYGFSEFGLTILNFEDCHFQFIPVDNQNMLRRAVLNGIVNFQTDNGLKGDGEVGPKTIAKLKEVYK